jgi:hypothetical protein
MRNKTRKGNKIEGESNRERKEKKNQRKRQREKERKTKVYQQKFVFCIILQHIELWWYKKNMNISRVQNACLCKRG